MDRNQDRICQYVVLEGEAGHQDAIVRTECSVNMHYWNLGYQVEKLGYAIANWNRGQAQTKMASDARRSMQGSHGTDSGKQ